MADKDSPSMKQKARWAKVFRQFDADGSGQISGEELAQALDASGFHLPPREFKKFLAEVDSD